MANAAPSSTMDDESYALQLQLEEIEAQREHQTGKRSENQPPDSTVAFDEFDAELKKALTLFEDLRLARNMAGAIDEDDTANEEQEPEEAQYARDRELALRLSRDHDESSKPVHPDTGEVECSVCGDKFHPNATVRLACNDIYCKECLKSFFLRVTKDESLFPPKCHGQPIDIALIEAELSDDELDAYRLAEQEFTSTNRIYCARPECARFIPETDITDDCAYCEACGAETCPECKALAHDGRCPEDEDRERLRRFGRRQGWQTCYACGEMVVRDEGCDHMT